MAGHRWGLPRVPCPHLVPHSSLWAVCPIWGRAPPDCHLAALTSQGSYLVGLPLGMRTSPSRAVPASSGYPVPSHLIDRVPTPSGYLGSRASFLVGRVGYLMGRGYPGSYPVPNLTPSRGPGYLVGHGLPSAGVLFSRLPCSLMGRGGTLARSTLYRPRNFDLGGRAAILARLPCAGLYTPLYLLSLRSVLPPLLSVPTMYIRTAVALVPPLGLLRSFYNN
ncbi:unnamed protein product [Calypogeia fissa]